MRASLFNGFKPRKEDAMSHVEEQAWIHRAQAGDPEAFAALVEYYRDPIYRVLRALTQNTHAAEDLTQEVFLKAWAKLKTFKQGACLRPWLTRIARNAFLNSRRGKQYTTPHLRLQDTLAAREPGPVAVLETQETQTMVDAAVDRLPHKYQMAFLLRTREEQPFLEIAQALSITAATARWHVFQARQQLLQNLGPLLDRKRS
jgi:RNA polymerase sigma-70 factor (ECF subfamily)